MSRVPERLDELIDRVAADLTRAPMSPGFAARLVGERERGPSRMLTAAASIAAVVAAGAAVSMLSRPPAGRTGLDLRAITHEMPLPPLSVERPAAPARARGAEPSLRPAVVREAVVPLSPAPSIPALEPPAQLALEELAVEALSVPSVNIERLDISTLALQELSSTSESKEHP